MFNFESLEGLKPRVPSAFLLAFAMVVGVEAGVRAIPESKLFNHSSRMGFTHFIDADVLPKFKQPQMAIFGTSRSADAIMPTRIDQAFGLPPNSTANLSMFASHTSDWEALYRRNREKLSHVKLTFCALDEWSFSSGYGNDEHFCLTAPFWDRINYTNGVETPELPNETPEAKARREAAHLDHLIARRNVMLLDGLFSMRLKLGEVPAALFRALKWGNVRKPRFDSNNMIRSNKGDIVGNVEDVAKYDTRVSLEFANFDTHPIYVRHVESIAKMVKEDGGTFVLLQLPNRRRFQNEVDRLAPEAYAQHKRVVEDLAKRLGVKLFFVKYPEEIGLTDYNYEDYGHMVTSGAIGCTDWLIQQIRANELLK